MQQDYLQNEPLKLVRRRKSKDVTESIYDQNPHNDNMWNLRRPSVPIYEPITRTRSEASATAVRHELPVPPCPKKPKIVTGMLQEQPEDDAFKDFLTMPQQLTDIEEANNIVDLVQLEDIIKIEPPDEECYLKTKPTYVDKGVDPIDFSLEIDNLKDDNKEIEIPENIMIHSELCKQILFEKLRILSPSPNKNALNAKDQNNNQQTTNRIEVVEPQRFVENNYENNKALVKRAKLPAPLDYEHSLRSASVANVTSNNQFDTIREIPQLNHMVAGAAVPFYSIQEPTASYTQGVAQLGNPFSENYWNAQNSYNQMPKSHYYQNYQPIDNSVYGNSSPLYIKSPMYQNISPVYNPTTVYTNNAPVYNNPSSQIIHPHNNTYNNSPSNNNTVQQYKNTSDASNTITTAGHKNFSLVCKDPSLLYKYPPPQQKNASPVQNNQSATYENTSASHSSSRNPSAPTYSQTSYAYKHQQSANKKAIAIKPSSVYNTNHPADAYNRNSSLYNNPPPNNPVYHASSENNTNLQRYNNSASTYSSVYNPACFGDQFINQNVYYTRK